MKKLGAWLIETSHNIARWWKKLTNKIKCMWNTMLYKMSFNIKECTQSESICVCKK